MARRSDTPGRPRATGLTLLEMLIVVMSIGLLMSVLVGAYDAARGEADVVMCAARLRGLGQALTAYADACDGHLPDIGAASTLAGPPPHDGYHFPDRWDSPGTTNWPFERRAGNAGNLYLLVRLGLASLDRFVCPASGDRTALGPFTEGRVGWLAMRAGSSRITDAEQEFLARHATRHCSYSYQNVMGHPACDPLIADPYAGDLVRTRTPAELAILADHNPYTQILGEGREVIDPDEAPLANSLNHAGRGQNVLTLDGCVRWHATPECGADLGNGRRDNIYRPATGDPLDPYNIPRHVRDSYLVP